MENTGRFQLPMIMPSQAQKHVTHNEALTLIDGLIHLAIKTFGDTAPPVTALVDDAFVVGASATGGWFGQDGNLAFNTDAGWRFAAPVEGLNALDLSANRMVIFDQGTWKPLAGFIDISVLPKLGINTSADTTNRLAIRSNAALLTALESGAGGTGDLRLTVNKETVANTASLIFQTGWSGRAEFGLSGDDDFRIKVSPDGSSWTEALRVNRATGAVTLADNSVANAALQDMPAATLKGRSGAAAGDPENLTAAQAASILPLFSVSAKGLTPPPAEVDSGYLKADGSWAFPEPSEGSACGARRFHAFNDCMAVVNDSYWTHIVSGTGAAHTPIVFANANSIGAIRSSLGTTASGRTSLTSSNFSCFAFGSGIARYSSRLRLASLSDGVNTWSLRNGFVDTAFAEPVDGVYFRYADSVNGGRFQAVCRSASVETVADTGVAAATGVTMKMDIDVSASAASAVFRINGATVATIAANIPAGAGRETGYGIFVLRSAGTAAVNTYEIDYLSAEILFTDPR